MKDERRSAILAIIAQEAVETQEQLLELLRRRGICTTQATISRDVKKLRLIKSPMGQGRYRYALPERSDGESVAQRLRSIFHQSVTSVQAAENLVVLKTLPGLAGGACEAVDHMAVPAIVGTLAGENTVLVVMKDRSSALAFCREIQALL